MKVTGGWLDRGAVAGTMAAMRSISLALGLSLWAAAPAAAQTSPTLAADRAQLASCLRTNSGAAPSCIGSIAVACVVAAGANRSTAEAGCARREEAVWREKLVVAVQQSGRPLDAGQRSRLVALQMSWEGYVAQKCAFYAASQREALQPGRQAGCELREVAARVLELERASRPQAPARRPSQPPQIIR
jgi:uncharacterized protein YecT (DUF1311 family)